MLKGLDPLLNGETLAVLREMGHGDTICIADRNFPAFATAESGGARCIRIDADAVAVGRAILSILPLDSFVPMPLHYMEAAGAPDGLNDAHTDFLAMVHEVAGPRWRMAGIERFDFYPESAKCVAIFATLEPRGYANFILRKGVIGADGNVV